jgi:vacuolar-type H+-ATPase catalytic subunit A/Vma1
LKIDLKNFEVSEEKYREMVRKAEIVNQELKDKIEKSKEISKHPEVLMKIVRLIHKSTLADKKVN